AIARDQVAWPAQRASAAPERLVEAASVECQALRELGRTVLAEERARGRCQDLLRRRGAKVHQRLDSTPTFGSAGRPRPRTATDERRISAVPPAMVCPSVVR